jgi:hypothetical protein
MKCKYCPQEIDWKPTVRGKNMCVEAHPYIRDGSEPTRKGTYIDETGVTYRETQVPCKVNVWRCHWSDCPGSEEARKQKAPPKRG